MIISQVIIGSTDVGTFTYAGSTPTINEGFLLGGFTGFATFLNGQTVHVIAVGPTTFTAIVTGTPGTYLGLSGTATSTTGAFVGPNPPTVAQDIDTESTPWSNVDNVLGDIGYASVNLGAGTAVTLVPSGASNQSSTLAWTSPNNLVATGASYATVALSAGQVSAVLLASGLPFVLPADAIVQGLSVAVSAASSSSTNGAQGPKGCAAVSGGAWTNPTYIEVQDGNSATNIIQGQNANGNYSTSGYITASGFGFSIPVGATVTGITSSIVRANLTGGSTYIADSSVQLLKAGVAVGTNMAAPGTYWPSALQTAQYGGSSNLWGTTWAPADINNTGFGIQVNVQNDSPRVVHVNKGVITYTNGPLATAGIDYISLTVNYTQGNTSGSVTVQLFNAGIALSGAGVAIGQPVTSTALPYVLGNNSYLWGQSASNLLSIINGGGLGVSLLAALSGTGTSTFEANSLSVTAYYTSPDSDALQARTFNFALAATIGITGFLTTFQAYSTNGESVSAQLLQNGVPVGTPIVRVLNSTPTIYSLGGSNNLWGTTWLPSDVNSLGFGVQFVATGTGTTFVNDVDMLVYVTPSLENFNYIKSYIQNNGQTTTLVLDASGDVYQEDVTHNPGVLTLALTGVLPGSFAQSATADDNEYLMFSDLSIGTDRPRVVHPNPATGVLQYLPLSQVGPGAPPSFQAAISAGTGALDITAYTAASNVVTFTFVVSVPPVIPVVGSLYTITDIPGAPFNNKTLTVLGTPAPTSTTFAAGFVMPNVVVTGLTGISTPTTNYGITSITQPPQAAFNGQEILWSAGTGSTSAGNVITFYYGGANVPENASILAAFAAGYTPVVYISGLPSAFTGADGTWVITGHGIGKPPGESGQVPFFTITYTSSNYLLQKTPGNNGNFQLSFATIITSSPVPDLSVGDSIQINGASPSSWNNSWKIEDSLKSGILNITSSQLLAGGIAQFQFNVQTGIAPINGQYITLSQLTNLQALNTIGVVSAATGSTFQVAGFAAFTAAQVAAGVVPEAGQGVTFGTTYVFDPGLDDIGTATDPIFGPGTGGTVTIIGGSIIPIGSGTRQAVCFFITETDFWSPASPFVIFTTSEDANFILANKIPIGPPNTVARGIAFTEAGQNGVPGANFYVIENDVTITVGSKITVYSSTIIRDNVTSSAKFTFTDAVLLNSTEIDIQGNDLFNEIELGSSAWVVPYASRNFYGLQLNKVNEFDNLSFDGGYLSNNPQGVPSFDVALLGGSFSNLQPLGYPSGQPGVGWNIVNPIDQSLVASPVTGLALYILNTYTAGVTASVGMIYQTAYQDQYGVAIIEPNVAYSVRVTASNPSGNDVGNFVVDLVDYNAVIGFSHTTPPYGSFVIPLSSMTSEMQVFTGTLLTTPFTGTVGNLASTTVPVSLVLREWLSNSTFGSDVLIDRIEVFATLTPYLKAQVYGSYANDPEAIDGSDNGGIVDTTSENAQAVYGAFVMHDLLYLAKQSSLYSTEQNPNSEPGGWSIKEVSNKVGACGIHALDTGDEWALMACRAGIFGFSGGQPVKLSLEIFNLWDAISWASAETIVVKNDIANKRFYVWVPLPTGTSPAGVPTATVQWLPNAPYNPAPTSPNVCIMCNYQGLDTAAELFAGPGVHTTMFGSLSAVDMKRKYTIWQIPSPYADFIYRPDGVDLPLLICNGIGSSKVYQLETAQLSDDGVAINSDYCCYGFVNAVKAATVPLFGMHRKQYTVFQVCAQGAGSMDVTFYPDTLSARYPISIPTGIALSPNAQQDYYRPVNITGNRMFVEFSTDAVGNWMHVDKVLLTGKASPWSSLNPTGGGSVGIIG